MRFTGPTSPISDPLNELVWPQPAHGKDGIPPTRDLKPARAIAVCRDAIQHTLRKRPRLPVSLPDPSCFLRRPPGVRCNTSDHAHRDDSNMVASGRSASQPVGLAPSNDRFQSVNTSWTEICDRHAKANQIMNNHDELFAPYLKIFEYDNRQLTVELIPLYRKMLDVFTEHYWLADSDTRAYYQEFLEFVEVWERFLAESLPRGNVERRAACGRARSGSRLSTISEGAQRADLPGGAIEWRGSSPSV
jgi:hypothetical protein